MNVALRAISLFAGGGGLCLGLERAGVARTVCRVEHEAYAASVLAARSRDGSLADAPVWSDVSTFDGRPWRGAVDLIFGGFPCQDISSAGLRAGIEGERSGLWKEFARIIREVGPRFVFVENVSALLVRGLDVVLADLAALGFDAEWGVFRASDVGAPHRRERVFILGHSKCGVGGGREAASERDALERTTTERPGLELANSDKRGRGVVWVVGVRDCVGTLRGNNPYGRGRRTPWPPGPKDDAGWADYLERWPMLEPAVRRGADGMANRVQRLRLLGNGVVPDQAALAWRVLWGRLMETP